MIDRSLHTIPHHTQHYIRELSLRRKRSKSCYVCVWCGVIYYPIVSYLTVAQSDSFRFDHMLCILVELSYWWCVYARTYLRAELLKLTHQHDMLRQHWYPMTKCCLNCWAVMMLSQQYFTLLTSICCSVALSHRSTENCQFHYVPHVFSRSTSASLDLAQLVEHTTVTVTHSLYGRWFDSGSREIVLPQLSSTWPLFERIDVTGERAAH